MSSEDPMAPFHDWSTLGARRPLLSSLGLFCAEGFEKVSNIVIPLKRIVFSLYSVGHVLSGPMVLGHV